ncbi:PfkB family carbohydrate kinase [Nocardia sp. CA-129566]|uniref:PfkB family carbohydrate kinase n=1 Tax=Nocardia sp. CA-129566 TaxID=3239976 RepID=UPI003D9692C7
MVAQDPGTHAQQRHSRGAVTVIGDAVMDHIYRTDTMPSAGSEARGTFDVQVGGKGLNRAVAAARLGLSVRLVAVVGDDDNGRRIIAHLRRENVDTGLVEVVAGATPVAVVMVDRNGAWAFIGRVVEGAQLHAQLHVEDLRTERVAAAIASSDALLLTFELPTKVINEALSMVRAMSKRPRLLVHPAPPVPPAPAAETDRDLDARFDPIDYVNGSSWELGELARGGDAVGEQSGTSVASRVLARGAHCVCEVEHLACRVRSDTLNLDIPPGPQEVPEESPAASAAFDAALAYRLVTTGQAASREDFEWASAAMAATRMTSPLADGMPTIREIDQIVAPTR